MKRQWEDFHTKEIKTAEITEQMIRRTQAYAGRIGFPCINVVMAVKSYTNPDTNKEYTEEEAIVVLKSLGIDYEKDIIECKKEYEEYEKWCAANPAKYCKNCGHPETWHHYNHTNKCQFKDCPCEDLKVENHE